MNVKQATQNTKPNSPPAETTLLGLAPLSLEQQRKHHGGPSKSRRVQVRRRRGLLRPTIRTRAEGAAARARPRNHRPRQGPVLDAQPPRNIRVQLCLTLHTNEANYLSHTQGKKHQAGLARRAAMEAKLARQKGETDVLMPLRSTALAVRAQTKVKIGRPGYEVSKSRDPETNERCMTFELHYPELDDARTRQPRHRFMSAYEQRVETPPDGNYQYLLVACDPYETVGFKIPNEKIDKGEGKFVTNWDVEAKVFTLTLHFLDDSQPTKKRPRDE